MNILVTGKMNHLTKQVVRQLVDNGHHVHYQANDITQQLVPATYDWLIQGMFATPQHHTGGKQTVLRAGFKQLQTGIT